MKESPASERLPDRLGQACLSEWIFQAGFFIHAHRSDVYIPSFTRCATRIVVNSCNDVKIILFGHPSCSLEQIAIMVYTLSY